MYIVHDKKNDRLVFTLESQDFVNEVGHNFIRELKLRLPNESYCTEKYRGKLIWSLDYEECIGVFIQMFKKYYPEKSKTQKIKQVWYESDNESKAQSD